MSLPARLSHYLDLRAARYEIVSHPHSRTSAQTARTAHVPMHDLAKSVVLEDDAGFVVAVVPGNCRVRLREVAEMLGRHDLHLSDEARIAAVFDGCEPGAVPPIGMAWNIETVVDDELEGHESVYLECGDHQQLLRLSRVEFRALMNEARHGHFSKLASH